MYVSAKNTVICALLKGKVSMTLHFRDETVQAVACECGCSCQILKIMGMCHFLKKIFLGYSIITKMSLCSFPGKGRPLTLLINIPWQSAGSPNTH